MRQAASDSGGTQGLSKDKIAFKRTRAEILLGIKQGGWQPVMVAVRVHGQTQTELPQIVGATDSLSLVFCIGQRWQQQGCQDGDDGNDNQQLDQGESGATFHSQAWICPVGLTGHC